MPLTSAGSGLRTRAEPVHQPFARDSVGKQQVPVSVEIDRVWELTFEGLDRLRTRRSVAMTVSFDRNACGRGCCGPLFIGLGSEPTLPAVVVRIMGQAAVM